MNNEIRIEYYLLQLDRELHALSVSQRAEIITEIKSHILEAQEKDPTRSLDKILMQDLGAPRTVAERYLAVKGLTPMPRVNRGGRVLKWLAVSTVAFFALIFVAGLSTLWYFSPIVHVDEDKGRVVLLGGLIDVNETMGKIKIGDMEVNGAFKDGKEVSGQQDIAGQNIQTIKIPFNSAKLELHASSDSILSWDCEAASEKQPTVNTEAGVLTLNLDALNLANCSIGLPRVALTEISGVNGDMEIDQPQDNMTVSLDNGKVNVEPHPSKVYDFEVKVKNGLQDFFPRSADKDAVKVKIHVVNGLVKKD